MNGVLLKGSKVVVPRSMRREILDRVHTRHLGLRKCKERARSLIFWPGLNSDITRLIQSCPTCKKYAYKQPQEPLLLRETPACPWYRVGADLFAGRSYVVVFDALSNFPEVEELRDTKQGPQWRLSVLSLPAKEFRLKCAWTTGHNSPATSLRSLRSSTISYMSHQALAALNPTDWRRKASK